ncbi:MAG: LPXTG-motif cell wall anchor domain protein, partial [Pseudarthrobacter sp.]|nr:LPXTG-motif cell wall anchor domain protein [Pseudarthrobacter sp.]
GIHAAGEGAGAPVNFAVAATLNDALAVLPGYQLELFLNKPAVTSPGRGGTVDAGQAIAGKVAAAPASAVAAGSAVRITVAGQKPFEVPVDGEGNWQFTAPETSKGKAASVKASSEFRFTAETVNGFSTSGSRAFAFDRAASVPPVTEPEPPVTEPEPGPPAAEPEPQPEPDPGPAPDETKPAPSPVAPAGSVAVVEPPAAAPADADPADTSPADTSLANTGADGVLTAAVAALVAIAVGGVLMVLARRRRNRHTPRP